MSEDRYSSKLDDYVDATLGESERRSLEAHLESCDSCRTTTADLLRIRATAETLARVSPPEEVWKRIAYTIRTEDHRPARSKSRAWLPISIWSNPWAIAATVVLALGVGFMIARLLPDRPSGDDPAELTRWVATELGLAEQHYQNAIGGLETIVATDDSTLDREVMAVLQQNLSLIEQAIDESRQAVRQQPDSQIAGASLISALRRKLSLLQNTVLLINEVRKGKGENALDLIDEMRDSESPNKI